MGRRDPPAHGRCSVNPVFDPAIGEPGDRVRYHSTRLGVILPDPPKTPSMRRVRLEDGPVLWLHESQFVLVARGRAA